MDVSSLTLGLAYVDPNTPLPSPSGRNISKTGIVASVGAAFEAIANAARTGSIGDGKIFVFDVAHAARIRTGDIEMTRSKKG